MDLMECIGDGINWYYTGFILFYKWVSKIVIELNKNSIKLLIDYGGVDTEKPFL